ncbi:MBL fold metallo-hydrolase, partial [Clavibacter californiensis]
MSAPWHVSPGGPSHVHVAGDVEVRKASVGPMDNDAYLLTDLDSGERLLVDAAADVDRLLALVEEPDPAGRLAVVVTTHGHADHHGALAAVLDATGASSAAGDADAGDLPVDVDRRLADGD